MYLELKALFSKSLNNPNICQKMTYKKRPDYLVTTVHESTPQYPWTALFLTPSQINQRKMTRPIQKGQSSDNCIFSKCNYPAHGSQLEKYKSRKKLLRKRYLIWIVGMLFLIMIMNWTWQKVRHTNISLYRHGYERKGLQESTTLSRFIK